jgi:hypothetical protein
MRVRRYGLLNAVDLTRATVFEQKANWLLIIWNFPGVVPGRASAALIL